MSSAPVVVVGVDHSEGAKAALRFAFEEARLRHARLRVVHAWQYGVPLAATGFDGFSAAAVDVDVSELREAAERQLEQTVQETVPASSCVEVERRLVEGRPAGVLVEASRDADLLVVGSRGHGGFAGLLLGSVSQQVSQHAECPVAIVRAPTGG